MDTPSDRLSPEQEREVERLVASANLHRMREQLGEAEDAARQALSISPGDVVIRELLADVLHESGKLDAALEEYKAAMRMTPDKPALEAKYAKVVLDIAEREREKAVARDMVENPKKYTARERNPGTALLWAIIPGMGQFYNGDLVKAGVIWGVLIVFLISWTIPQSYIGVSSLSGFIARTNPLVLVLGTLFLIAYFYGIIDAPITAERSSKAQRSSGKQI